MASNILEEQIDNISTTSQRTKIKYLQENATKIEIAYQELLQNSKIVRHINEELVKNRQGSAEKINMLLQQQNINLEKAYFRITEENEQLLCSILMQQQIIEENQNQHKLITKQYEDKIIELRRSIQYKECSIQHLQDRLKCNEDIVISTPTTVNMLFFAQIDQLRQIIDSYAKKNKELQKLIDEYLSKLVKIEKKCSLIQNLCISNCTFGQLKQYLRSKEKRMFSCSKAGLQIPFQANAKTSSKKSNQVQTRQVSQFSTRNPTDTVKMLLLKKNLEHSKLTQKYQQINKKYQQNQKQKNHLIKSSSKNQKKIYQLANQLNYFKKSTQQLLKILAHRRDLIKSKQTQTLQIDNFIKSIKFPAQITYISDRKKYWTGVKESIRVNPKKILDVKKKLKIQKSLSCVLDYKVFEVDGVDKYLLKQKGNHQEQGNLNDFSMMIQQAGKSNMFDDFSIIKHSTKTTFSDWKKSKNLSNNLTLIQQNIL